MSKKRYQIAGFTFALDDEELRKIKIMTDLQDDNAAIEYFIWCMAKEKIPPTEVSKVVTRMSRPGNKFGL